MAFSWKEMHLIHILKKIRRTSALFHFPHSLPIILPYLSTYPKFQYQKGSFIYTHKIQQIKKIYIELNNKVLLYSTGNYTQYPGIKP